MKIKILYEDKDILAIDKPSGILVHPDERSKEKTILDIFIKQYPKVAVVHRLDKETSGVLLLAKNAKAHEFLKQQFQDRSIKKTYIAIVSGSVKDERGFVKKPIGRSPNDFRKWLAGRGARGELREAETFYRVLKRIKKDFTVLEVRPKTGRTHQIRVHMKYLNHPIVGDELYNPNGLPLPLHSGPNPEHNPLRKGEEKGGGRMMLHAKSIEFKNLKGETIKIESPLLKEFQDVLK